MLDFTRKFGFVVTRARNVDPEMRMLAAITPIIGLCDLVVDVGANQGQFLESIIDIKPKRIIAIEPEIKVFQALNLKFGYLHNFESLNLALGGKSGSGVLQVTNNSAESSSLLVMGELHKQGAPHIDVFEKQNVRIERFSDVVNTSGVKSIFLKIDVQGFELEVLRGISNEDFQKVVAIRMELNLVQTYVNAPYAEEVIAYLRSKGFSPMRVESGFGLPNFGQQLQIEVLFTRLN